MKILVALLLAPALVFGQAAPSLTADQQRDFLKTAQVVSSRPAGKGITGSLRLTLSDGKITHDASFQTIEDRATVTDRARGRKRAGEVNFADSYKYNIAAYEIAKLLGLGDMMPVTVERRWRGETGSLSWWVDNYLMDEEAREKQNLQPPDVRSFQRQRQKMFVFAELVRDTDRNKGNVLYTKDWRVIMIDFSRAFRVDPSIRSPDLIPQCERRLYEQLQTLTEAAVRSAVGDQLTRAEVSGVMARRQLIVDYLAQRIREKGEAAVLDQGFQVPGFRGSKVAGFLVLTSQHAR